MTLFDPLGIGPTEWLTDRGGEVIAASGLRMTPRELARIGLMLLKGGVWGDRRVVAAGILADYVADRSHWLDDAERRCVGRPARRASAMD